MATLSCQAQLHHICIVYHLCMLQLLRVPVVTRHAVLVSTADALVVICWKPVHVLSAGYTSGQDGAHEQSASKCTAAASPAHWQGSSRQPLQTRSDHDNAACLLPDCRLQHQGSGEALGQQSWGNSS